MGRFVHIGVAYWQLGKKAATRDYIMRLLFNLRAVISTWNSRYRQQWVGIQSIINSG